jgi:NADPH:quinone reductase-like Zn-dependent oxidoreductase
MRAIAIDKFGGPDELKLREVEPPLVGPNDVRVRVAAAGVNPGDARVRTGMLAPFVPHFFPLVLGFEGAGTVELVGPAVADFEVGQEVFGSFSRDFVRDGAYAELSTASARSIAHKPPELSFEIASVLTAGAVTAVQLIESAIQLKRGETLLVHGASGAVGSAVVQLAHGLGSHVIGTASSANMDFLREIGADEVIDYASEDFATVVQRAHPAGIDAVVDLVGGATHEGSAAVLKPQTGRFVSVAQPIMVPAFASRGIETRFFFAQADRATLERVAALVVSGRLTLRINEVLPLADARRAHELLEAGHHAGKLILDPTK